MLLSEEMMKDYPPSLAAAKKLSGGVPENFSFYEFEWLGDRPKEWTVMKVVGAVFREAKRGPRKGQKVIIVEGTERTTYVTVEEIEACRPKEKEDDDKVSSEG